MQIAVRKERKKKRRQAGKAGKNRIEWNRGEKTFVSDVRRPRQRAINTGREGEGERTELGNEAIRQSRGTLKWNIRMTRYCRTH